GQGDEIARVVPFVQAVLDANPTAAVTIVTPRRYLYDHPRVEPVSIRDAGAVAAALAQPADGIVHVREPLVEVMNCSPALNDEVEGVILGRRPPLTIRTDVGRPRFLSQTGELGGRAVAPPRRVDQVDAADVCHAARRRAASRPL